MNEVKVLLNHGSGGKMTHDLIGKLFIKYFDNPILKAQTDAAVLHIDSKLIAFTTDSYVVTPVFFPGGNIGKLAICGTVNDLSVSGTTPLYLSCGFIIEEGLLFSELEQIVSTMAAEAAKAGVLIVTGDTKVVEKGKCDKIFINTAGVGVLDSTREHISFGKNIVPGDSIIINGEAGNHGAAILCARNSLEYYSDIESDCASLNGLIKDILQSGADVKFMRDATRGGLATILCELAERKEFGIKLNEKDIPLNEKVRGLCEIFGFDPLFMANEGKVVIVAGKDSAEKIVSILHSHELGKDAAIIGEITEENKGLVVMNTGIGGSRLIDMPAGEQLPRIC